MGWRAGLERRLHAVLGTRRRWADLVTTWIITKRSLDSTERIALAREDHEMRLTFEQIGRVDRARAYEALLLEVSRVVTAVNRTRPSFGGDLAVPRRATTRCSVSMPKCSRSVAQRSAI